MAERHVDELDQSRDVADKGDDEVLRMDEEALDDEALDEDDDLGDEDEDEDEDTEDDNQGVAVGSSEDEDSDEASLDELLAKRSAKRGSEDAEDADGDIMSLVGGERDEAVVEPLPIRAQPIRDRQEFVCSRCRLVKPKVQLADEARGLCRDCV